MNQDEQFRSGVQQLVAEGKLTPEEAEQLLGASALHPGSTSTEPHTDVGTNEEHFLTATSDSVPSQVRTEVMSYRYDGEVPPRLHLSVQGYSLTVRVDQTVTQPVLSASHPDRLELVGSPQGWRVSRTPLRWDDKGTNWLERILNGFSQEGNLRAELVIPNSFEHVDVKVQGGNLVLPSLGAAVNAVVQGGNITLGDATDLTAKVQGGNLKWHATVQEGQHDLRVQGGNATLELAPGSSIRLNGDVLAGNMSASGFEVTKTARDYVNATYAGVLQDGRASVSIKVQGGNAKVVAQ